MSPAELREYRFWKYIGFLSALILGSIIGAAIGLTALAIKAALLSVFGG